MILLCCEAKIERSDMKKGTKKENGKIRRFSTRLTEEDYKEITEKAKEKNMTKTDYIMSLVKKDKIKK